MARAAVTAMPTDDLAAQTLPRLLLRNARSIGGRPALREKDRGVWQTTSWAGYWEQVRDFALGLAAAGFGRDEKLSVIGDNRPRLYFAQLAAQALGGVAVPVYQDSIASELAYVLGHAEVSVVVAEDQEQVDKILSLRDRLPALRLVVFDDPRGMSDYADPMLRSFEAVAAAGRAFGAAHPGHVEAAIGKGAPGDVAMLAYTSGTTGNPKGTMLTHGNLIASGAAFVADGDVRPDDDWLAYLPMAWVGDSLWSLVIALIAGLTANCPESPETVQRDLRELGPSGLIAPPRIWENMLTSVQVKAADASGLKRVVFEYFRGVAERVELLRGDGKPVPAGLALAHRVGEVVVYGPVRDQLGLRRARWALTGGAPLGPDAFRFFRGFGVNLKQVYGATECSALIALQPDGQADPNTVGRPVAGTEVKVGADGEILIRAPAVFAGYFKQPDATKGAFDPEGWFRTGDAGFVAPNGHLVVIDRAKDVGKTADGTAFAPQYVENKLKFSPFIREAIVFGNERPFVAAMVAIDMVTVGAWAERKGLAYTSYVDLAQKPEVRALVADEVRKCNAGLPEAIRIRRFLLLTKEFDADDAEITRTRKLRRGFIAEKYAAAIRAFYEDASETEIVAEVTFEDGRKGTVRSNVTIERIAA